MIRFIPDTLRDAILRPVAMAWPEGGVYVEILAPDFRFVFALVLALVLGFAAMRAMARGTRLPRGAALILLGFTALAFVPWLHTTGNGRYFMAFLLIVGPLCIGLLHLIPATRSFRLTAAISMVFIQGYLLYEANPWHAWNHVEWKEPPAFGLDIPPHVATQPATYVTLSSISYSLIAPRFHPESRWINVSTLQGLEDESPNGVRARTLLAANGPLKAIFPSMPGGQEGNHISKELARAIDELLARQGLSIHNQAECLLMKSAGLAGMASARASRNDARTVEHGFWLCPLARNASPRIALAAPPSSRAETVFAKMEKMCPRFFSSGVLTARIPSGAMRAYPDSDFKAYVLDNGEVWYKYYRALNPVLLGNAEDVLDPAFKMDCEHVQGRSGLPWERGI